MYFKQLTEAFSLDNQYSLESLRESFSRECELSEWRESEEEIGLKKESANYSLAELFQLLKEPDSGLNAKKVSSDTLAELTKIFNQRLAKPSANDALLSLNATKPPQKKSKAKNPTQEDILADYRTLVPQSSFSIEYKEKYLKTGFFLLSELYNDSFLLRDKNIDSWEKALSNGDYILGKSLTTALIGVLFAEGSEYKQLLKKLLKQRVREYAKRTCFDSNDLSTMRLYQQTLVFLLTVENRGQNEIDRTKREANSYIAYFLADGFCRFVSCSSADGLIFAKQGLEISDPEDLQDIFNILGVCAIDSSGQKQLAYDTYFSWLNRCVVGDLIPLIPNQEIFSSNADKVWRENHKDAEALMRNNFAYVCSAISDTYELQTERCNIFRKIALREIEKALTLNPKDANYHCTCGTLLSEDMDSLKPAIDQFKRYHELDKSFDAKLTYLRSHCDTLLDFLSNDFIKRGIGDFIQWSKDAEIQNYLADLNHLLKEYRGCTLPDFIRNDKYTEEEKKRDDWRWSFQLVELTEKNTSTFDLTHIELSLMLSYHIAKLIKKMLRRREYSIIDYYTREDELDCAVTGHRKNIKPVAYYTTLHNIRNVFDELYQSSTDKAPRKLNPGDSFSGSGKNCLTIMNSAYMNDPHEGLSLLNVFFSDITKSNKGCAIFPDSSVQQFRDNIYKYHFVFLKSFTEKLDKLFMWNRYASDYVNEQRDSNGCCVQLDPDVFQGIVDSNHSDNSTIQLGATTSDDYYLYRVVYLSNDGSIEPSENPGLPNSVVLYFTALRTLISTINEILCDFQSDQCTQTESESLRDFVREFLQNTLRFIIFLFKDKDYSEEAESRIVLSRTANQQDSIRLLPTLPEKLCINPFFQVYITRIIFGPNVQNHEQWRPYFQYQLNKMWKKHPDCSVHSEQCPQKRYQIENSKIHYRS